MRILIHQTEQWKSGGIEKWNLVFCKKLSKYYDITFLYNIGDERQLDELRKYVKVVKFENQLFETDICIFSSAWGNRPENNITAKRYIQMVHADYKGMDATWKFTYKKLNKVTEHWSGSKNACKTFKEKFGYDCKYVPYLMEVEKPEPVLHLISLTRFAREKGMERITKMAHLLKESGRKFRWDIWGTGYDPVYVKKFKESLEDVQEVCFRDLGRELESYIKDSDYLVQLSNSEGYCLSMYESLMLNTPVIATAFPNAFEQIEEGVNGYILPFELFEEDIKEEWEKVFNKICNEIPKFKFKPFAKVQDWIDVIGKPDGKKEKTLIIEPKKIKVKCVKNYTDLQLKEKKLIGQEFEVSPARAEVLLRMNLVKVS